MHDTEPGGFASAPGGTAAAPSPACRGVTTWIGCCCAGSGGIAVTGPPHATGKCAAGAPGASLPARDAGDSRDLNSDGSSARSSVAGITPGTPAPYSGTFLFTGSGSRWLHPGTPRAM